jgi:hypothetical protein
MRGKKLRQLVELTRRAGIQLRASRIEHHVPEREYQTARRGHRLELIHFRLSECRLFRCQIALAERRIRHPIRRSRGHIRGTHLPGARRKLNPVPLGLTRRDPGVVRFGVRMR